MRAGVKSRVAAPSALAYDASMGAVAALIDFLLPPCCAACSHFCEVDGLCPGCRAQLVVPRPPLCARCGTSVAASTRDVECGRCLDAAPNFDRARAAFLYEGDALSEKVLSKLLYRYKYGRDVALAPLFARLMLENPPLPAEHDVISPVPLHPARLRWRGFNQALLIARLLAPAWAAPVDPFLVRRVRDTPQQVGLADAARRRNLRGAFRARPDGVRGRRVLLVDDVLTTGATVDECARVLHEAGAALVDVLVLARAVRRS